MTGLLKTINDPADLRRLPRAQLRTVADELRACVLENVARTGGHLSSNLGTVELTVALHYVFNTPDDRLVWDVGHQTYPHKILTGRRDRMPTLRQLGGLSGFPQRSESEYDSFGTAHSSTSISAALGMALASRQKGESRQSEDENALLPERHGQKGDGEDQADPDQEDASQGIDQQRNDPKLLLLEFDRQEFEPGLSDGDQGRRQTLQGGEAAFAACAEGHGDQRRPIRTPRAKPRAAATPTAFQGCSCTKSSVALAAALALSTIAASASAKRSLASRSRISIFSRRPAILSPAAPAVARRISSASEMTTFISATSLSLPAGVSS